MEIDYSDTSPKEAVMMQRELRHQIKLQPLQKPVTTIAGADLSFNRFSQIVHAGIVVLSFPDFEIIDKAGVTDITRFPYVPGLLGFKEVPALSQAWEKLKIKPDVLVVDGHGYAHPRRMGIATHFGVVMNTPTIGCAKTKLVGEYKEPLNVAGAMSDLTHEEELIGKVYRTKVNCKPIFISPGNLITMEESLSLVSLCVRRYRIPEPTRLTHNFVNEVRLNYGK
ncbi:MAG: deoxyribonuclease V [Chitinophagaceae bacterium]|nr:deoxyribonuclease V [Chitinophagaceae bacterium]